MKRNNIILLILLSWLTGLGCCHIICNSNKIPAATPGTDTKAAVKKLKATESVYEEKTAELVKHNSELAKTLKTTTASLAVIKRKANLLQEELKQSINRQQLYKDNKDTVAAIETCDSAANTTTAFIAVITQQDSLQEEVIRNLTSQVINRDTIIITKNAQYHSLRQQFDNSIANQSVVETQLKEYKRILKRQQRNNKLKSIGMLFISGIAISQLLR